MIISTLPFFSSYLSLLLIFLVLIHFNDIIIIIFTFWIFKQWLFRLSLISTSWTSRYSRRCRGATEMFSYGWEGGGEGSERWWTSTWRSSTFWCSRGSSSFKAAALTTTWRWTGVLAFGMEGLEGQTIDFTSKGLKMAERNEDSKKVLKNMKSSLLRTNNLQLSPQCIYS